MTLTVEEINAKHEFAVKHYAPATTKAAEVEELFKAEYAIPKDQADPANPGGPRVAKPARPRSILDKHLTLLSVRATHSRKVIGFDTSHEEIDRCSKIERWMSGYERQHQYEVKKNVYRDATWWYLFRGRACLETRYDETMLKKGRLPLMTLADDPLTIYPMYGRHGLGYYTKETDVPVWDLRADIARHSTGEKDQRWKQLKLVDKSKDKADQAKRDNETVALVEYYDENYRAALADGELLYCKPNKWECIPLAEARCLDTPLASTEWAFQSVLSPIADSLKQTFAIVSKMASGVDLYYYPTVLVVYEDGRLEAFDGGKIKLDEIPRAGVKNVTVIQANPNSQVLQMLLGWLQGDISLATLPDIAWGAEPTSLESGFAISQVLAQVLDKIEDKKQNLEMAFAWDWSHKLRLMEKYGDATGTNLRVPAEEEVPYGAY